MEGPNTAEATRRAWTPADPITCTLELVAGPHQTGRLFVLGIGGVKGIDVSAANHGARTDVSARPLAVWGKLAEQNVSKPHGSGDSGHVPIAEREQPVRRIGAIDRSRPTLELDGEEGVVAAPSSVVPVRVGRHAGAVGDRLVHCVG